MDQKCVAESTVKIGLDQDKQNALIDYLLKGDLDGAKQLELEGASFLYRNKQGLYPLVAAVYGTNLEALRYIEGKLKKEEAELQWSEVYVERAKKEIASEMPRELRAGATQRELAEWYENSGLDKMKRLYDVLCLKIEGFDKWDSVGGCESFLGRAAWTRKQGRSWNDPPNIDLTIMDSACRSGRGNLFLPSRWTHDSVVNQIRNQLNELKKLVETKAVKQPVIMDEKSARFTKNSFENQKEKYLCPISYQIMAEPVTASDGHVYEKEKIEALLAHSSNPLSPLTREALNKNHPLVVNLWMRGEIANFLEENQGLLSDDDVYLPEKWKSGFANAIRNRNEDQYNEWIKKERRLKEIELEPNKTALELVCERGTPEIVKKVILDLGIEKVREKILSKNKTREDNAFYLAWFSNGWEVLKLLIEKLDLSHSDTEFLEFHKVVKKPVYLDDLFLKSAQNGNIKEMKWLLVLGANVNAKNNDGETALHLCAKLSLFDVCEYLIKERNAEKGLRDRHGNTALEPIFLSAVRGKNREVVECVLRLGADINTVSTEGKTALHFVAELGDLNSYEYLVKSGINKTIKDNQGKTAIEAGFFKACEEKSLEKIQTWIKLGCDISMCNEKGQTALHIASINQWLEGCEFLLKNKINPYKDDQEGRDALLAFIDHCLSAQSKVIKKAIDPLLELLLDEDEYEYEDENVRLAAACELVELGEESPAVIEVLLKVRKPDIDDTDDDNNDDNFSSAGHALQNLKAPNASVIEKLWMYEDDVYQYQEEIPVTIEGLINRLREINEALNEEEDYEYHDYFDEEREVLIRVVSALGDLQRPTAAVIDVLTDSFRKDKGVSGCIANALVRLGEKNPSVIEVLLEALVDEDNDFCRGTIVGVLGDIEKPTVRVIEVILKALENSDSEVRLGAVHALGKLKTHNLLVIENLLKALGDHDKKVSQAAAYSLVELGEETPMVMEVLLNALRDEDDYISLKKAMEVVGKLKTKTHTLSIVESLFKSLVNDKNRWFLDDITRALIQLGQESHTLVMNVLLKELERYSVAAALLVELGEESPVVVEGLFKALEDSNFSLRQVAVHSLKKLKTPTIMLVEGLLKMSSIANQHDSQAIANTLVRLGEKSSLVIEVLVKALEDSDSKFRLAAVPILGELKKHDILVIASLLKVLGDNDKTVSRAAAYVLLELNEKNPLVIEVILKALADTHSDVRKVAAHALGKLKTPTTIVIEALFKALQYNDEDVSKAAASALVRLGEKSPVIIDRLIKKLKSKDSDVRRVTTLALQDIETPNISIISALINALSDENSRVRYFAIKTLGINLENFLKKERDVNEKILMCLIKKSSLYSEDKQGNNALMLAVFYREMKWVKLFVEKDIPLRSTNKDGNTALMIATLYENYEASKYLIEKMRISEIESVNNEGDTGLIIAARKGNQALMQLFLEAGADIKVRDKNQLSLPEILKKHGHEPLVNFLNEQRKLIKYARFEENKKLREEVKDLKEQVSLLQFECSSDNKPFKYNKNKNRISNKKLPNHLIETSEQSVALFHQFWLHSDNLAQLTARYLEKREQQAIACVNKTCYNSDRFFSVLPQQAKEKQIERSVGEGDKLGLNGLN